MKNIIRIFIAIIFIFATTTFSQNDADKVLNDLQTKFDTIKDLSVEFTQSGNGKNKLAGMLFLKRENKLRIETKNFIIVTDGTTSWNYNKKENKVIISNYDENDPGVFSIKELVYELPAESDIELSNENGQNVLTLTPNSYNYSFDSAKLWINEDNLISKVVLNDAAIGIVKVKFSNYQLNQNLKDSEFSFTPPEGSRIIDIR
ncbi:MAG: outer membrane lipoprotein carrier protein LolA [Bacteroidetes bacterium]|nr:outer membrane lipoprotein carrier protein LolA [Bacteroidota bacterium]MCH8033532.1 outer membrane lipoprotein carrier protein LolA [Bacteroidota bacterium]